MLISIFLLVALSGSLLGQRGKSIITFPSEDSIPVTAYDFFISDTVPYLILMHDQLSSKGEFNKIITRFQKLNFNCLVPDLRNGGNANFVPNQTVAEVRNADRNRNMEAVEGDIHAAINYAYEKSGKKIILLGAGANGSLALKAAKEKDEVMAVIALSPGEFFRPRVSIQDTINGLSKPVLVTANELEIPYVTELVSEMDQGKVLIFKPDNDPGQRGTKALLPSNDSQGDYWLAILLFVKELQ